MSDLNWLAFFLLITACVFVRETKGYSTGAQCTADADCPAADATYCKRLTTVSPACQKGICTCRPGYIYDGTTACLQYNNITTLGAVCSGAVNERLTWGANCNASVMMCTAPVYFALTPTRCAQVINQPVYNQACNPTYMNTSCNSSLNFVCNPTTNLCMCSQTNMIYQSSLSACRFRIYGDPCNAQADCDTGTYTIQGGGGADCISSTCGCAAGYTMVPRISYDDYTGNLVQNATCTSLPEQTLSASGALVCNTSYSCIRCPEDTNLVTQGFCRTVLTSSCATIQSSLIGAMTPDQVVTAIKNCGGVGGVGGGQDTVHVDLTLIALSLLSLLILINVGKK